MCMCHAHNQSWVVCTFCIVFFLTHIFWNYFVSFWADILIVIMILSLIKYSSFDICLRTYKLLIVCLNDDYFYDSKRICYYLNETDSDNEEMENVVNALLVFSQNWLKQRSKYGMRLTPTWNQKTYIRIIIIIINMWAYTQQIYIFNITKNCKHRRWGGERGAFQPPPKKLE